MELSLTFGKWFESWLIKTKLYPKCLDKLIGSIERKYRDVIFNGWHSWDMRPWNHPWLTYKNLNAMRQFSEFRLDELKKKVEHINLKDFTFGFVGNIANNLYMRMVPLAKAGYKLKLFQHPQDKYVMSQPEWEEYEGCLHHSETHFDRLIELDYNFPAIELIEKGEIKQCPDYKNNLLTQGMLTKRFQDIILCKNYNLSIDSTVSLRKMDALWGSQYPYYCYLSGKPYVVSQTGGDVWFECSRGDLLGFLQRQAFKNANMFLVSNPWSYAHARRFGFTNLIHLPLILDETVYAPGHGKFRKEWEEKSRGDFFMLSTSRLDKQFKGNEIAIQGFKEFSRNFPSARLVLVGWGLNRDDNEKLIKEFAIEDKVIWLPVSGKGLLREYYKSADCFFDQFILGYYGAAGLEAMANGLPVISRIEREQYDACCATGAPPILQANTLLEVSEHLTALYTNKEYYLQLKADTRQWFINNHGSEKFKDDYISLLVATAKGIKPKFSGSPLKEQLSKVEKSYHEDQLTKTPHFPNYVL